MDVIELTEALVAIDSQNPGPGESEVASFVEIVARDWGIAAQRIEYAPGRPNLILTVDKGTGPHLGLCAHLDTKPVGQALAEWRTDPFRLTIHDGLAYGLGSSDMKGALAAILIALRRFSRSSTMGTLSAILTADEEGGSQVGAKAMVREGGLPVLDAMVIGEPSGIETPWEAMYVVSRGTACCRVQVRTPQGHSGLSERLDRSAVLVAADLIAAFEHYEPTVSKPGPIPCAPTVNPGMTIQGGVAFGTLPGWCEFGCEVRLVPGMDRDLVRSEVERFFEREAGDRASIGVTWMEGSLGWMPAVGLDPDTRIVHAAQEAARTVLRHELPLRAYPGGTDASYFMGGAGIPTITALGPGWLSVAHGPNECIGTDQLAAATDLYARLAEVFIQRES